MAKSRKPSAIGNNSRLRRHTPLVVWFSVGMVLLVLVLPSALNLPQTNPTTISEYAPVPPDDNSAPPGGNLASLGLSSSRGLGSGAGESEDTAGFQGGSKGRKVASKRCVGNPPRQTSDPMAPPCVAHFEGDNGGATAKGVTRDEVLILVYIEAQEASVGAACHGEGCDVDEYYDLGKPETESNQGGHDELEAYWPHRFRRWQNYFNDRYQTYDRFVHIWVHFGSMDHSPEQRRADVADAAAKLDPGPFAVIANVAENPDAYAEEWARRGNAVFMMQVPGEAGGGEIGLEQGFFQKYPGRIWGYQPSVEQLADNFVSFACAQVIPHPVSFSGDTSGSGRNGQPRKLGLLRSNDENKKNHISYGLQVRKGIEKCGGTIVSEHFYTLDQPTAEAQMADMRRDGVTTIIYGEGPYLRYSNAVAHQVPPWRPEWIMQQENLIAFATYENHDVVQYARNFSLWPRAAKATDRPCDQAWFEADPSSSPGSAGWPECYSYPLVRMLFTGIQVAGPRLTVSNMDTGFHRIPAIPNGDPRVPACFFRSGDYTCVKDAQTQWWDPTGQMDGRSQKGCWRSMEDGRRYLSGSWPVRDVDAVRNRAADGCNLQGSAF